jgi:hypothetical protein
LGRNFENLGGLHEKHALQHGFCVLHLAFAVGCWMAKSVFSFKCLCGVENLCYGIFTIVYKVCIIFE